MRSLSIRDLPMSRKLTLGMLGMSVSVLLLAGVGFAIFDYVSYRHSVVLRITSLADAIGYNSHAALLFDDVSGAQEMFTTRVPASINLRASRTLWP